jgi:Kelch motif
MASLQEARGDIKMVVNRRQQAFVAGGFTDVNNFCPALSTAEMYNIKTNTWSYVDDLSIPRGDMSLIVIDHHLIALGGETQIDETCPETIDPGESTVVMDDVEILDHNGHWEVVASIPDPLFRAEAVSVDNRIFIFGGQKAYNKTCRCYDTSDDIVLLLEEEGGMAHEDSPTVSPSVAFEVVTSSFLTVTLVLFAAFGAFI